MLSIVLAVLASIGNAVASVLQRRAAAALPEDREWGAVIGMSAGLVLQPVRPVIRR